MSSQSLSRRTEHIQIPPELWQKILRHAIFVPLFFDTDPVTSYGLASLPNYENTSAYWESERTRNNLRRVCSTWDAYLQRFAHRLVNLDDVIHNRAPITALPLAYRIHILMCKCLECVNDPQEKLSLIQQISGSDPPYNQPWRVKILKIDGYWLRENAFLTLLASRSRVRVYIRPRAAPINSIIEQQPSSDLRLYRGLLVSEILCVQSLSTLRLALDASRISCIPLMPNLRHLSVILINGAESVGCGLVVDWLQTGGNQLFTLFWSVIERVNYTLSTPIWSLCPYITSLQLPCDTLWSFPPPTHPITHFRLNLGFKSNEERSNWAPIDDIIRCETINTVSFDLPWSMALYYFGDKEDVACRYRWLKSHGIRYIDTNWLTFEEYVIFELEIARGLATAPNQSFFF